MSEFATERNDSEKQVGRFGSIIVARDDIKLQGTATQAALNKPTTKVVYAGADCRFLRTVTPNDVQQHFAYFDDRKPPRINVEPSELEAHLNTVFAENKKLPEGYQFNTQVLGLGAFSAVVFKYNKQKHDDRRAATVYLARATEQIISAAMRSDRLDGLKLRTILAAYTSDNIDNLPTDWEYIYQKYYTALQVLSETKVQRFLAKEKKQRQWNGGIGNGQLVVVIGNSLREGSMSRITGHEPVITIQEKERLEHHLLASINPDVVNYSNELQGNGTRSDRDQLLFLSTPEERSALQLAEVRPLLEAQIEESKRALVVAIVRETLDSVVGGNVYAAAITSQAIPFVNIGGTALAVTYWVLETTAERVSNSRRSSTHKKSVSTIAESMLAGLEAYPNDFTTAKAYFKARLVLSGDKQLILKARETDSQLERLMKEHLNGSILKALGKSFKFAGEEAVDTVLLVGPLLRDELVRMGELAILATYYNQIAEELGIPTTEGYKKVWKDIVVFITKVDDYLRSLLEGTHTLDQLQFLFEISEKQKHS